MEGAARGPQGETTQPWLVAELPPLLPFRHSRRQSILVRSGYSSQVLESPSCRVDTPHPSLPDLTTVCLSHVAPTATFTDCIASLLSLISYFHSCLPQPPPIFYLKQSFRRITKGFSASLGVHSPILYRPSLSVSSSDLASDPAVMSKNDYPPAYGGGPAPPQPAYGGAPYGQGSPDPYAQQQGGQASGYYQPGPQMGYYDQQQQQGPYPGGQGPYPPQPGPYGPPQGYYQQPDHRGNGGGGGGAAGGICAGLFAGLACCCCLDCLF